MHRRVCGTAGCHAYATRHIPVVLGRLGAISLPMCERCSRRRALAARLAREVG
jgi:hypothetical protein